MATASSKQRFNRQHPCPICGGDDHDPRGAGRRCFGFLSGDGEYAHCTREEFAGQIEMKDSSQTYPHKMHGPCKCGAEHNPSNSTRPVERDTSSSPEKRNRRLLIAYNYMNESGELLHQTVRWEPKGFSQRHPDGAGGWIWNLDGITPVLYRLPELLAADPQETVWIVEGEKDVETLRKAGLVATCNPMGAGKWRSVYNSSLKGRQVAIIGDNDAPGRKHAQDVAWHLHGIAKSVKVVMLPDTWKDVSDYFAVKGTPEKLREFLAVTPEWEKPGTKSEGVTPEQDALMQQLETLTLREILEQDFPEPEWVVPGLIPQGQVTVFAGKPKIGKSWWVFGAALAVVEGGKAFNHGEDCEQGSALYLALEDTPRRLKSRGWKMLKSRGDLHGLKAPEYLHIATSCPTINQGAVKMMDAWLEAHQDCKLIVIDTLAKIKDARKQNGDIYAEDYQSVQELIELAHRRNVGILVVTHCRKMAGEDVLDEINASTGLMGAAEALIVMRRQRGEDTATLHVTGKDVDEQELAMQFDGESGHWSILGDAQDYARSKEQEEILEILDALDGEASPAEVAKEFFETTGVKKSASTIRGILWRMNKAGLLQVTDGGKYSRNTSTASTGQTASTGSTPSTADSSVIHAEELFTNHAAVDPVDPVDLVEGVEVVDADAAAIVSDVSASAPIDDLTWLKEYVRRIGHAAIKFAGIVYGGTKSKWEQEFEQRLDPTTVRLMVGVLSAQGTV